MPEANVMEQIVSLCKRRGFVYPASEIYGGLNGFWDYGPLGVLLKNNIREHWWRNMVEVPPIGPDGHPVDIVGLDSAIIQNPKAWVASGHVGGFADPMVDCRECKARFRADHLVRARAIRVRDDLPTELARPHEIYQYLVLPEEKVPYTSDDSNNLTAGGKSLEAKVGRVKHLKQVRIKEPPGAVWVAISRNQHWLLDRWPDSQERPTDCPRCGAVNSLTEPRAFNLMFETYVGAVRDDESKAYLRPETAQGIFVNFKNVVDTTRVKVPFGVAQIGKSFRNEVTPRNFIFRSREFEQMEMEWFCHPDEAAKWYEFWKGERMKWWKSLGVKDDNLRLREHEKDELSHYSKMTVDIEYKYPFTAPDYGELEGIAHRGCFDLTQHQTHSGQKLDYFDQELQLKLKEQGASPEEIKAKSRYIPNVIEPASGLTRAVLVILCEAYRRDDSRAGSVEYLSIEPQFAPVKAGIFPLVNKEGMPEVSEKIYLDLRQHFTCEHDEKQSIGKRYARMDEIGTPFCVTVDGQTLTDQTVTVRERDAMSQERISTDKLKGHLLEQLGVKR